MSARSFVRRRKQDEVRMAMGTRHPLTRRVPALNGEGLVGKKTHGSTYRGKIKPGGSSGVGFGGAKPANPANRWGPLSWSKKNLTPTETTYPESPSPIPSTHLPRVPEPTYRERDPSPPPWSLHLPAIHRPMVRPRPAPTAQPTPSPVLLLQRLAQVPNPLLAGTAASPNPWRRAADARPS